MAPPKQKAASYELIETGGGEGYGSVEPASADAVAATSIPAADEFP